MNLSQNENCVLTRRSQHRVLAVRQKIFTRLFTSDTNYLLQLFICKTFIKNSNECTIMPYSNAKNNWQWTSIPINSNLTWLMTPDKCWHTLARSSSVQWAVRCTTPAWNLAQFTTALQTSSSSSANWNTKHLLFVSNV